MNSARVARPLFSYNCFNHSAHLGLPPSLPEQIEAAARAGYDHVGLDVPSLVAHQAAGLAPDAVLDLLHAHTITCYELVPLSVSDDSDAVTAAIATLSRLATAVDAKHLLATVRSEVTPALVDNLRRAVDAFAAIGVAVSVEFMPTSPLGSLEAAVQLIDATDDERLGIVIDIWHFVLSGSQWSTLHDIPVERVGFVQLDDAPCEAVGTSVEDSLHHRLLPGEGTFPIAQFSDVLAAKRYEGVVSVEVLSRPWRERPIDEFAKATLTAAHRAWFG